MILGGYCNCAPEDLCFTYGDNQKPKIETDGRLSRTVSFNLSHSVDAIQIAVAREGELGIDVEHLAREHNVDGLLAECLTDEEARSVCRLNNPPRQVAFLRYWVHKEAFLKCIGCGFSVSPKEVTVSFCDSGRSVISCPNQMADVVIFGQDLQCAPGYIAAIATRERECAIQSLTL
jgi:4'-phosphopantetheinyl transferase